MKGKRSNLEGHGTGSAHKFNYGYSGTGGKDSMPSRSESQAPKTGQPCVDDDFTGPLAKRRDK